MKRILLSLTAIFVVMTIAARTQFPRTVQGVPYTPKAADGKLRAASDWEWATPDDMAGDANFTFDMIKNWTGEGENKAALVIQWNYDDEPAALVFGYRWTGQATGADMLKAVVKNNPRLYALMQYTNVSSPTDPNGGYTLNGIGWDVDDDGDIALIDTGNGNQVYESEDGFLNIRAATSPDRAVPRIMTMTTGRRATRMTCGAPDGILRIGRIGLRTMLKTNSAIQVGAFQPACLRMAAGMAGTLPKT